MHTPSIQQKLYVKGLMEGKAKTVAAKEAGYSPKTAAAMTKQEKRPMMRTLILEAMEEAGITPQLLAKRMREGLDAVLVIRATQWSEREVVPDMRERREYAELASRITGALVTKHEIEAGPSLEALLEESWKRSEERQALESGRAIDVEAREVGLE